MQFESFTLWENQMSATLDAYILDDIKGLYGRKKRPAVIVCPGGAYFKVTDREAEPVAIRFASLGYHAFVLRYSILDDAVYPQPLYDLAKAFAIISENAGRWFLDSKKISVCGFSAGAHLAASLGTHWHEPFLGDKIGVSSDVLKPHTLILGYPLIDYNDFIEDWKTVADGREVDLRAEANRAIFGVEKPDKDQIARLSPANYVSDKTPPAFIWHTADDELVYIENSLKFSSALSKHKIPFELHVFESGVHGMALCDETTAGDESNINVPCQQWFDLAAKWLKRHE